MEATGRNRQAYFYDLKSINVFPPLSANEFESLGAIGALGDAQLVESNVSADLLGSLNKFHRKVCLFTLFVAVAARRALANALAGARCIDPTNPRHRVYIRFSIILLCCLGVFLKNA